VLIVKQRRKNPAVVAAPTSSGKRVMKALQDGMEAVRRQVAKDEAALLEALLHLPADRVVDMVTTTPWFEVQERIETELFGDLLDGGSRVKLQAIEKQAIQFSFDRSRPEAADWARKEAAELVTNITEDQRAVIRSFVGASLDQGEAPRDVARGLRNVVGLTEQQEGWVSRHYDRQLSQGLSRGLTPARAQELAQASTDRYHSRVFKYRTETIARTEILRASQEGRRQAWGQGIQQGFISPSASKQWSTNIDDRTCLICEPLNEMIVPLNRDFPDGEPPVHPNCRCDVLLIDRRDSDLAGLTDAELDQQIDDFIDSGVMAPRPKGMGDRTRISESDYQALRQGSAGEFITGRSADGVPIFTPERLAFHDRIVDDILENLPRSQAPRMDMLGGGPATGKSSQIAEIFLKDRRRTSAMIDPDNIKTRMPNYRARVRENDDAAAAFFHEESSYLAKRVQQAAIERRVDMIYDGTGDGSPESLARKIAAARENGYSVNGWYATIDIEEALERAAARAARTGREVPEDTIRATHAAVSRIFPTAVDEFDEIRLYDTTVRGKPSLIAEGGGGRLNVVDSDGYESFLAKGLD